MGKGNPPRGLGPPATGITTARSVAVGGGSSTAVCATQGADVWCWGAAEVMQYANNQFGQAGQVPSPTKAPL